MIVYKITNILDGKVYIGQTTVGLNKRWNGHCSSRVGCRLLHSAIKKYGAESFTKVVLEKLSSLDEMSEREIYWINYYESNISGYNLASGGRNPTHAEESKERMSKSATGRLVSEESKAKMSKSRMGMSRPNARIQASLMHEKNRGVPLSEEHKRKLSESTKGRKLSPERLVKLQNPMLGKKHTEETKDKIRKARLGRILSDETKIKIGLSQKGKVVSAETKAKMKASATGRKMSEEARANMSRNHFTKKKNLITNAMELTFS